MAQKYSSDGGRKSVPLPTPHMALRPMSGKRLRSAETVHEVTIDVEATRTKRYWQRFALSAAQNLSKYEKEQRKTPRKEMIFSARVGHQPKFGRRFADEESENETDISLLSCSHVGPDIAPKKTRHRRRRTTANNKPRPNPTDWERFAKERRGVLDRIMRQDANTLQAGVEGTSGVSNYGAMSQFQVTELLTQEERDLLMSCAFRSGIATRDKSYSTENLVNSASEGGSCSSEMADGSDCQTNCPNFADSDNAPFFTDTTASPTAPSRLAVMKRSQKQKSPFSCNEPVMQFLSKLLDKDGQSVSLESRIKRQVKARMHSTASALDRLAGFGDPRDQIRCIEAEKGRYTDTDYSRVPRYPQNVRLAPQLVTMMHKNLRDTMSRPKRRDLTKEDLSLFNESHPPLDCSNRNLVIFNWLNSLNKNIGFRKSDGKKHSYEY